MFWLKVKMGLLVIGLFAILFAIVSLIAFACGVTSFAFYFIFSLILMGIQYMVGPRIVEWSMRVKYVTEKEYSELHNMVSELAKKANIPKPKVGVAQIPIPNAFAFGRWRSDGRVCVTQGITRLLSHNELRAVLGHELSHLKNRDVLTITLLSVIPIVLYRIAWGLLLFGSLGRRREGGAALAMVGMISFLFYFITNLLVLYASRIREYFADRGSIELGNRPDWLASALYKLVYGNARIPKAQLRQVEGLKAFFINDCSRASQELRELKDLDLNRDGIIEADELSILKRKRVKVSFTDRCLELLSTHPNMLTRIKQLSSYE
ncbi:M48 family metalloprotease [candidate division WOR-3 bacterium]|nr:M48 family metalloprotease [candidate division WOR-3 bacterium]